MGEVTPFVETRSLGYSRNAARRPHEALHVGLNLSQVEPEPL